VEMLTFGGIMLPWVFIVHVFLRWDLHIWGQVIGCRF
jgi:hypothetical protein